MYEPPEEHKKVNRAVNSVHASAQKKPQNEFSITRKCSTYELKVLMEFPAMTDDVLNVTHVV